MGESRKNPKSSITVYQAHSKQPETGMVAFKQWLVLKAPKPQFWVWLILYTTHQAPGREETGLCERSGERSGERCLKSSIGTSVSTLPTDITLSDTPDILRDSLTSHF